MVEVNKLELSDNKRHLPYADKLEEFLNLVALAKPLCSFSVDNECTSSQWIRHTDKGPEYLESINRVNVIEDGEVIGSISVGTRYRAGGKESVYGVESFRIRKERGTRNTTYVKDIKVAIRNAKKFFAGREDYELVELIKHKISEGMSRITGQAVSAVTWSIDSRELAFRYAMKAYEAYRVNAPAFTMPTVDPIIQDHKSLFKRCEEVVNTKELDDHYKGNNGYGIKKRADGGYVCFSYASHEVKKYNSFDDMPTNIQDKVAMFKVLETYEVYPNFGVKFDDDFYYVP